MQVMNPELQHVCATNVERAYFGTAPTLFTLRCAYHDEAATEWMLPQLYDLGEYCGVKEKLDNFLKVTEVMLFLHRLKSGHYGHFYGAIDPMVIVTALRFNFMRERADAIDEREHAEKWAEWEAHCRQVAQERAEAIAAGRPIYPRPVAPQKAASTGLE